MPSFRYSARTQEGEIQTGVVDAATRDAAIDILHQHHLIITGLTSLEGGELRSALRHAFFDRVSRKDIVLFSRQIAILFETRVPVLEALQAIAAQTENQALARIVQEIISDVDAGMPLSDTFAKFPKAFSPFYVNMVRSGEAAGKLQEVFMYLAQYLERQYVITAKIRGALAYPAFILIVFFVVAAVMVTVVLPEIGKIFAEEDVKLPVLTQILLFISGLVQKFWWLALAFLITGGAVAVGLLRTPTGRAWLDAQMLHIPIFGKLIQSVLVARMTDNLGTLVSSGLPIVQALEISAAVVGNVTFQEVLFEARAAVQRGEKIHTTFRTSRVIPQTVVQMVAVGERTGQLDRVLRHMARFYQQEVDQMTDNLVSLIEPVIIVAIGVLIGVFVATILLPIYNLATVL